MTDIFRRSTLARWLVAVTCVAGAAMLIAVPPNESLVSTLTAPADGQNWTGPTFQWTTIDGADGYYLYVGTTVGAKDVVDTGELQVTSKTVANLPAGVTLYARMWTKHGGVWRYRDSTFALYPLTTTLTSPSAGQTDVPVTGTLTWQAIPNFQAYYLYVGTTVGANNVINTGENQTTTYPYVGLQPQTTYYARMWTKMAGAWRYVDSTFTTAALTSQLSNPVNGATNVPLSLTLQWTSVPTVQAYYLYLGTAVGLKDLVNTGETSVTAWSAVLPSATTIYARLWTKTSGTWRYVDTTFTTASGAPPALFANLTYPLNDAPQVPVPVTFTWNAVPNAEVYYLYVGSTTGLNDLVDSRELTQTSFTATLPGASTVHARLWTRVNNIWRYVDSKFGTQSVTARLSYPVTGLTVSTSTTFTWNPITGAQAYRLQIGSTQGGAHVLDSGETTQTQWPVLVPDSSTLHARLWTKHNDTWRYSDSTFATENLRARFTYPVVGAIGVDPQHAFDWTAADDADGYTLQIGTSWGGNDLLDTGEIQTTSYLPSGLPASQTLYARIRTRSGSITRVDDTIFTLATSVAPSEIVAPADGESSFSTGAPFRWTAVEMASAYRLRIGTAPGTGDLHDSGELFVTRRFIRDLPTGVTLYGQVQTLIGNAWSSTDFTFSVGSTAASHAATIEAARAVTADVRQMADVQDQAMPWSPLGLALNPVQLGMPMAGDYTSVLLTALAQLNTGAQSRSLDVAFTPGTTETHQLVEFQRPDTSVWMLLDPMFALTVNRTADGTSATAADVNAATVALGWSDVTYDFLAPAGNAYVAAHYVDYPLFFLNIGTGGIPPSPAPYLLEQTLPISTPGIYVIGCDGASTVSAIINGQTVNVSCPGPDTTSGAFFAGSITVPPGGSFQVFTLRRFVF